MVGESADAVGAGVGGGSSGNKMPTLEEYGTNLTKLAEEVLFSICPITVSCVIEFVTTGHQRFSSPIIIAMQYLCSICQLLCIGYLYWNNCSALIQQ